MRGSYSGNTLAFQANAESSILLPRSTTMKTITFITPDQGRPCDGCTKCCQWLTGKAYDVSFGEGIACTFLNGQGCGIYESRPLGCRDFQCYWKITPSVPEWLKPNLVNVIMKQEQLSKFRYINVIAAGDVDPKIFDWINEQTELGINFIIYETKQLFSKDEEFKHFIMLLNTKFGD